MIHKNNDAYKSIGEVAKILDLVNKKKGTLNTHTIRFWEKEFKQIKPKILNGNRRYYNNDTIEVLKKVKYLLKDQGMTIIGVKKVLNSDKSLKLDELPNNSINADYSLKNKLKKDFRFNKKNKKFKIKWQKKHTLKLDWYQRLNLIVHFFIMLKNQQVVKKLKLNYLLRNTIPLQENMKCLWKKNYLHTVNSITFF